MAQVRLYRDITEPDRRRYNQAWFSRTHINATDPDDHEGTVAAVPARTPLSAALDRSRQLLAATGAENEETDPEGSVSAWSLRTQRVQVSNPLLVELRGLEPLTLCMPCRCATSCATAPLP